MTYCDNVWSCNKNISEEEDKLYKGYCKTCYLKNLDLKYLKDKNQKNLNEVVK